MTEDEARKKWCPMVRHSSYGSEPASNRFGDEVSGMVVVNGWNACIASGCMMWVWNFDDGNTHPNKLSETDGRCGLAR